MTTLIRNLIPVALLLQVGNVVQADTPSSSSSPPTPTPPRQLIALECAVEISTCATDSECATCLTALLSADIPDDSTTSDTDCPYAYTTFCEFLQSAGCNVENAFADDFAACAAGETFAACDGFESCSVYLSATPTVPPTSSPISTPSTQTPSGLSIVNPSASSSSSTHGENTAPTASPTSSPTSTSLTQTPSGLSIVALTASSSSTPTMTPTASPSSTDGERFAHTSSPVLTTPTPTPSVMSTVEPPTPSLLSTDDDEGAVDASGASRRLQGVWSTASFCFSLVYVARVAYAT